MFDFFKKNNHHQSPQLLDLDKKPIQAGDIVQSLRYDLGRCKVIKEGETYYYESLDSGERVSWIKMIDAATEMQKVRKVGGSKETESR